jgi:hypothetical protein
VERPELLDALGSKPGEDGAMSILAIQDRPGQLGKVTDSRCDRRHHNVDCSSSSSFCFSTAGVVDVPCGDGQFASDSIVLAGLVAKRGIQVLVYR